MTHEITESTCTPSDFTDLKDFRIKHSDKVVFAHLNINSVRHKLHEVSMILDCTDIFCITETKLDDTFTTAQFKFKNYSLYRKDRNAFGGGIMIYVNTTLPSRIRDDLLPERNDIECIVLEIILNKEKIFLIVLYKPPKVSDLTLISMVSYVIDKCMLESNCIYLVGDLNVNLLNHPNSLSDVFESYNLNNVVKEPTCFKSMTNPTLLDPIITNNSKRLAGYLNACIGVSDFHNIVCAATKLKRPSFTPQLITYRSYKNFDESKYVQELSSAPFHVATIFDDVDDIMWFHNRLLTEIVEVHAPLKKKVIKRKQVPYMNGNLRRAINVKAMLKRKFDKYKSQDSWEKYKRQRNQVNRLKRESMLYYFKERCNGTNNAHEFWKTISPFMSNKNSNSNCNIPLFENGEIISDQEQVANIFNNFFVNITQDLSEPPYVASMQTADLLDYYANHSSIVCINNFVSMHNFNSFSFTAVTHKQVNNKLKGLKTKKACGFDGIPAKLLKIGAEEISPLLCKIMNISLEQGVYPYMLKQAEIVPLFKKNDQLNKKNYRPVSILVSLSKIVEGLLCDQLMLYFQDVLCKELSAYRKLYGCSNVLLQCVEQWKQAIDNGDTVGCVLMDLSKAFDSIPHGLVIAKLAAYGVDNPSCEYLRSYLMNRKQRVKIGSSRSLWLNMERGVPQGSLTGPVLFNIFINDLIVSLKDKCYLYNYADDNTLACIHKDPKKVKINLEEASQDALRWFKCNFMEANPSKFQAMVLSRKNCDILFNIEGNVVKPTNCVKLLGMCLDDQLNFNEHVKEITVKCARQVSAMGRLSKQLNVSCKQKIFDAFVLSNFNYCTSVYHFCNVGNSRKLEQLQKRALRYVYLDFESSYENLLLKAGKSTLYINRLKEIMLSVYKIINGLMPPMDQRFFETSTSVYNMRFVKMKVPQYNTVSYGKNSIRYQGAKLYNDLKLRSQFKCLSDFKQFIRDWKPECACGSCLLCL